MTRRTSAPATDRFVERLASLSDASFAAFCAALWAARGFTVERSGDLLFVERAGEAKTLLVRPPPSTRRRVAQLIRRGDTAEHRRTDSEVDVVVTPSVGRDAELIAEAHEARLVGPATLLDVLRYGVDRETADALAMQYFGVETDAFVSTGPDESADGPKSSVGWVAAVTVGAACCLVAAAVLAGVWVPDAGQTPVDDVAPPLLTGAGVESQTGATANDSEGADASRRGASSTMPPGVTETDVDAETLASAHADAVTGTSYRLIVRQSETDAVESERHWRGVWQHAVVADDHTWLYSVIGYEQEEGDSQLVQYTAYANGDVVYQRGDTRDGAVYNRSTARVITRDDVGLHTERTTRYVERYLATSEVEVDRPTWRPETYRLVATGRPTAIEGRVSNYTATALVNQSGFVSELTVEFTRHEAGETRDVRFRMEYAAVNETRVRPPGWLTEAQDATTNATSMNETTTSETAGNATATDG